MATNPYANKVEVNGTTVIDLTSDTVTPEALLSGYTAHGSDGAIVVGTLELSQHVEVTGETVALPAGGTIEKLSIFGKTVDGEPISTYNILNRSTCVEGKYITGSGSLGNESTSLYTDLIPVVTGENLYIVGMCGHSGNKRLHGYNQSGTWVKQINYAANVPLDSEFELSVPIPSGISYVRFSYSIPDEDVRIVRTTTKPPYLPYGSIGLLVTDAFGTQRSLTAVGLDGNVLASYSDTEDVLELTADGNGRIIKNDTASPRSVPIPQIVFPSLLANDMLRVIANITPTLKMEYVTQGGGGGETAIPITDAEIHAITGMDGYPDGDVVSY